MKYFAAVGDKREISAVIVMPPIRMLFSYHYWKNKVDELKTYVDAGYECFLDSGAFSAATTGAIINIDEYCKFIKDSGSGIYAGLDVIGDAKKTRENTEYMAKEYGLNPIPTFHMGSDLDDLEKLMSYPYIALGGLVFSPKIVAHCDRVWTYILKNNPSLRVHGFGLTSLELMDRYPWHSVDSSSFKSCRRFGRQGILYGGFNFETILEREYWELLKKMGYPDPETLENNERYFLYDFHSVQSYKMYAEHLGQLNKYRNFEHLKSQLTLF